MISDEILRYIKKPEYRRAIRLPDEQLEVYEVLAQGEYNKNYVFTHPLTGRKLVLRVNYGSQMHLEHQIEYEAGALGLIESSGRTPHVYYVDGTEDAPEGGVLVMDHLPGRALDYESPEELKGAAECLADIHAVSIDPDLTIECEPDKLPGDARKLIAPRGSARAILSECEDMLAVYLKSDLPPAEKKNRLRALLDNAWKLINDDMPSYRCCINTELNSTNFLADKSSDGQTEVRLIDWEKPLYGDPAQDLAHFLAPTTTFWKTDVILDNSAACDFTDTYIEAVGGRFDISGLKERTLAMIPVTCLRGMTWCAMAWVQYQDADKDLVNESTAVKLDQYLSDSFISDMENRVNDALTSAAGGKTEQQL